MPRRLATLSRKLIRIDEYSEYVQRTEATAAERHAEQIEARAAKQQSVKSETEQSGEMSD